jgi:hypothetical protein
MASRNNKDRENAKAKVILTGCRCEIVRGVEKDIQKRIRDKKLKLR